MKKKNKNNILFGLAFALYLFVSFGLAGAWDYDDKFDIENNIEQF